MRGTVVFEGSVIAATAVLELLGCRVLSIGESQHRAMAEVEALGSAADRVALAECEGLLEFTVSAAVDVPASSGVYTPVTLSDAPHRPIVG